MALNIRKGWNSLLREPAHQWALPSDRFKCDVYSYFGASSQAEHELEEKLEEIACTKKYYLADKVYHSIDYPSNYSCDDGSTSRKVHCLAYSNDAGDKYPDKNYEGYQAPKKGNKRE